MFQENFMIEIYEMPALGIMLDTYKAIQLLKESGFNERQSEVIVDTAQRVVYINRLRENIGADDFNKLLDVGFSEKQAAALVELVKEASVIQSRRRIWNLQ